MSQVVPEKRSVRDMVMRTFLIALVTSLVGAGTTTAFMVLKVLPTFEIRMKQMDERIKTLVITDRHISHVLDGNARPGLKSQVAKLQEQTRSLQRQVDATRKD